MNPEKRYGPIPIDTDSELTEVAAESGMSLQELKDFLRVNHLGIFRPGSVPIAEEVTHSGRHQLTYDDIGATLRKGFMQTLPVCLQSALLPVPTPCRARARQPP